MPLNAIVSFCTFRYLFYRNFPVFNPLMILTENGFIPELEVMAISPSLLKIKPNGCGAVKYCLPNGVISLPFGITPEPSLLILAGSFPAGAVISNWV